MEYFLEEFSNETKAIFFLNCLCQSKGQKKTRNLFYSIEFFFQITKGRRNDKLIRQITKVVYAKQ